MASIQEVIVCAGYVQVGSILLIEGVLYTVEDKRFPKHADDDWVTLTLRRPGLAAMEKTDWPCSEVMTSLIVVGV